MKRKKWDKVEEEKLIELRALGLTWHIIAKRLGRSTEQAVSRKYHYMQQDGRAPYSRTPLWGQVKEMQVYCKEFGHRATLKKYGSYAIHFMRRNNLWKRSLPVIKVYPEKFLSSQDKYYWSGFFAADGCVKSHRHVNITLASKDTEHLLQLHKVAGGAFYVTDERVTWDMHNASEVVSFFATLGITPRKTYTLMPPVDLSQSQTRDYIRGYFDGDGCVTSSIQKRGCMIQLVSFNGTYKLLHWIRTSFSDFAGCKVVPAIRKTRGIFVLSYGSFHDFKAIYKWLYTMKGQRLDRKYLRFNQILGLRNEYNNREKPCESK